MHVIGIDQSLTGTGCVTLKDGKMIKSILIKSKPTGPSPIDEQKRLETIANEVARLSVNVDLAVIEGLAFMARNTGALTKLAGLQYLIRHELLNQKINFVIVPPTTLKKFVTGKGNCHKDLMLLETYKRYGISFSDNNLCDAFGLAKCGEALLDKNIKLTKFQVEVIDKIKYQYYEKN